MILLIAIELPINLAHNIVLYDTLSLCDASSKQNVCDSKSNLSCIASWFICRLTYAFVLTCPMRNWAHWIFQWNWDPCEMLHEFQLRWRGRLTQHSAPPDCQPQWAGHQVIHRTVKGPHFICQGLVKTIDILFDPVPSNPLAPPTLMNQDGEPVVCAYRVSLCYRLG